RQTKVERVFQILVLPTAFERLTAQHFKEQARASAGGMLLFPRRHVAGTHGAAVILAALAYADAAQSSLRKMAVIFRKRKIRLHRRGAVGCAKTQILVERIGVNLFARIHFPAGVPYALELAEGFHQLRAEHADQKLATRLTVAVLAGERAAHGNDHICSFFNKSAK